MPRVGWIEGLFCMTLLVGCGFSGTPRPEDASAPRDYWAAAQTQTPAPCSPKVEILTRAEVRRPYREIGSLSATCYPGAPTLCEQRLSARACVLHADALILNEPESGGTPPGASAQSQISLAARAVRWTD